MIDLHTRMALGCGLADHALQRPGQARVWVRLKATLAPEAAAAWAAGCGLQPAGGLHAVGWVPARQLAALAGDPAVADLMLCEPLRQERAPVRRPAPGRQFPQPSAPPAVQAPALTEAAPAPAAAVLGLIDHGLPVAHRGVCRSVNGRQRTRFLALWDQDEQPDFGPHGQAPAGAAGVPFGAGAVLRQASIDAALALAAGDEAAAYALLGYGDLATRRTHGSHVLGLLAMDDPWVDGAMGLHGDVAHAARQADLLGVQLPRALLHSPSRAALCGAVLDGLRWMLQEAGDRPLQVAVPYGSTLGPHDGSSLFEQALDRLIADSRGRLQVFLPSGNSYAMDLHARLASQRSPGAHELIWLQPPGSEAASFIELWLPAGTGARFDLRDPSGRAVFAGLAPADQVHHGLGGTSGLDSPVSVVYGPAVAPGGQQQEVLLLRLAPTLVVDSGRAACQAGHWRLQVHGLHAGHGALHAYGSRARGSFGAAARAQQGRFLAAPPSGWRVSPVGSISGMATGLEGCVVGGYVNALMRSNMFSNKQPAHYTAQGPGRAGRGVDFSLASEASQSLGGVRSAGTRTAISWRMDGSSVAVPQAIRVGMSARGLAGWRHSRLGRPIVP